MVAASRALVYSVYVDGRFEEISTLPHFRYFKFVSGLSPKVTLNELRRWRSSIPVSDFHSSGADLVVAAAILAEDWSGVKYGILYD